MNAYPEIWPFFDHPVILLQHIVLHDKFHPVHVDELEKLFQNELIIKNKLEKSLL